MDSKITPEGGAGRKEKNQNIQVFVRVRPMNTQELSKNAVEVIDTPGTKEVVVRERSVANLTKTFTFDRVFGPKSKQTDVYKVVVAPLLNEVLLGYNCTVFAYGQTGTGKTFTMEGERSLKGDRISVENDPLAGILPRALSQLFDEVRMMNCEFTVRVSFLELYNEELFDLLAPIDENKAKTLRLFEDSHRKGSVIIQGLEEVIVQNKHEVYAVLDRGTQQRKTAATLMNASSSRSHTVFTITVHMKESSVEGEEMVKVGKLHLVDLAGSENIGKSGAVDKRAREAGSINQSLLTLGRVITALVERTPHIPYRESKLTRLLQDSLGGKTKTSIIATISPAAMNIEETLSTLDYAHRAKNIMNRPEVNQRLTKKEALNIYTEEIERLRRDLVASREKNGCFVDWDNYNRTQCQIESQKQELNEKSNKIKDLEEALCAKEDELREALDIMGEMKEDLLVKQTILEDVQGRKKVLESKLNRAEMRIDELSHLVQYHEKTEEKMSTEATDLLHTTKDTVKIIDALHGRLERKQHVEERNWKNAERFRSEFRQAMDILINNLSSVRESHSIHTSTLRGRLNERNRERLEKVENFYKHFNQGIANMQQIDRTLLEISEKFSGMVETKIDTSKKIVSAQCGKSYEVTSNYTGLISSQIHHTREVLQSVLVITNNMQDELDSSLSELVEFMDMIFCENEDCFDKLEKTLTMMKSSWGAYFEDLLCKWDRLEGRQAQFKENHLKLIAKLEQTTKVLKEEALEYGAEACTAYEGFQKNTRALKSAWEVMSTDGVCAAQKGKEGVQSLKMMLMTKREEMLDKGTLAISQTSQKIDVAARNLDQIDELSVKNEEECDMNMKQILGKYDEAKQEITKEAEKMQIDMNIHLQSHSGQLSRVKEDCLGAVRTLTRGEDQVSDEIMKRLDEHCDVISDSTSKISSGLHKASGSVDEFWEETYLTDTPSGATPCRRKYELPTKLSVPSPQERVLARYRRFQRDLQVAIEEGNEDDNVPEGVAQRLPSDDELPVPGTPPAAKSPCRRKYEFPTKLSEPSPRDRVVARNLRFQQDLEMPIAEGNEEDEVEKDPVPAKQAKTKSRSK